ncbi:MAG: hypothetical protein JKX76_02250 [Colwellia sp.]|nr:hypothetical protein [Colwellia sp.]
MNIIKFHDFLFQHQCTYENVLTTLNLNNFYLFNKIYNFRENDIRTSLIYHHENYQNTSLNSTDILNDISAEMVLYLNYYRADILYMFDNSDNNRYKLSDKNKEKLKLTVTRNVLEYGNSNFIDFFFEKYFLVKEIFESIIKTDNLEKYKLFITKPQLDPENDHENAISPMGDLLQNMTICIESFIGDIVIFGNNTYVNPKHCTLMKVISFNSTKIFNFMLKQRESDCSSIFTPYPNQENTWYGIHKKSITQETCEFASLNSFILCEEHVGILPDNRENINNLILFDRVEIIEWLSTKVVLTTDILTIACSKGSINIFNWCVEYFNIFKGWPGTKSKEARNRVLHLYESKKNSIIELCVKTACYGRHINILKRFHEILECNLFKQQQESSGLSYNHLDRQELRKYKKLFLPDELTINTICDELFSDSDYLQNTTYGNSNEKINIELTSPYQSLHKSLFQSNSMVSNKQLYFMGSLHQHSLLSTGNRQRITNSQLCKSNKYFPESKQIEDIVSCFPKLNSESPIHFEYQNELPDSKNFIGNKSNECYYFQPPIQYKDPYTNEIVKYEPEKYIVQTSQFLIKRSSMEILTWYINLFPTQKPRGLTTKNYIMLLELKRIADLPNRAM